MRRLRRLLFPSPAELDFIRLLGGRVLVFKHVRLGSHGFPLAIVLSLGRELKAEHFRREVRIGAFFADLANDVGRALDVDGVRYHTDKLREQRRDEYCAKHGYRILHISGYDLYHQSRLVRERTLRFIHE